MSERDWRLFLKDIQESSSRIVDYVGTMPFDEFFRDTKSVDAVMRNLAIIGEAAKSVPSEKLPEIKACESGLFYACADFGWWTVPFTKPMRIQ